MGSALCCASCMLLQASRLHLPASPPSLCHCIFFIHPYRPPFQKPLVNTSLQLRRLSFINSEQPISAPLTCCVSCQGWAHCTHTKRHAPCFPLLVINEAFPFKLDFSTHACVNQTPNWMMTCVWRVGSVSSALG